MSYMYKTRTIKPENEKWYPDVEPVKHADFMKWFKSYPGVVSFQNRRESENEHIRWVEFSDQESYERFIVERNQREDYIERQQWLESHGFIVEVLAYPKN